MRSIRREADVVMASTGEVDFASFRLRLIGTLDASAA